MVGGSSCVSLQAVQHIKPLAAHAVLDRAEHDVNIRSSAHCVWCVVAMMCAGKWGYYALGAYGSLAMAIFMVKTMKRVIFQETRAYGKLSCWRA